MDKNQIVKSNQVIEASYQLSAVEQRIVLAAIS
ncbi:RepB family plasmid replication initiator protein, partial [Acinetobacter baumannii]